MAQPGIIEQYINATPLVKCGLHHVLEFVVLADIGLYDKGFPSKLLNLSSDLFKPVQAACRQGQAHAISRQSQGDSCTDSTGCTGDDDHFMAVLVIH